MDSTVAAADSSTSMMKPFDDRYEVDAPKFYDFTKDDGGEHMSGLGDDWFEQRGM